MIADPTGASTFAPPVSTKEDRGESSLIYIGGSPTTCISLALNLWATFAIGYKAWIHKSVIKKYLSAGGKRTQSEKILLLLIDSGLLYCALWAVVTAGEFQYWRGSFDFAEPGMPITAYLQDGALIHLVGIYPTVLVIMFSLQRSQSNKESGVTVHTLTQRACAPSHCIHVNVQTFVDGPAGGTESIGSVIQSEAIGSTEDIEAQNLKKTEALSTTNW
ncbi:hypothetical protein BDY19DRAFT_921665 [Irpex rosettiformis]|uniref:Uncharacterized protein n=1 Tax=Irpex rosettiformis TaxID=378272 RepID=A0ACB8UFG9_9APHY|nr:hypothetical protein BDY19DRAFT_921665 [Irpex rosettiformis]